MPPAPNPKTRQEIIETVARQIFEGMVSELQFDTVLRARKDADKAKRPCRCCGTYCSLPHTPGASTSAPTSSNGSTNKTITGVATTAGSSGSGTPTKDNANIYLPCPVCKRPFASNRVAAHLANCMGISNGGRRARNAKVKLDDRSASPYVDVSDETMVSGSQKPKSKKKDSNGNGKRPGSPSLLDTPKKSKKQKVNSMTESMDTASITSSGLRKSSTASSILDGAINGNTNFASASPSMYSSPNSTDSTESGGSTMIGHGSQSKPTKVGKSHSSTTTSATSRGPPGSSKGRSIAAARLMGEGETASTEVSKR